MPQTTAESVQETARSDDSGPAAKAPDQGMPEQTPPPRRRRMSRWLRPFLLLVVPLLIVTVAAYFYFTGGRYVSTENAYVKADMVMIGAQVSGPITDVLVEENQPVRKGDVLFRIDDRPYAIALAEANAQLATVRDEILAQKAAYQQKQEELQLARTDLSFAKKEFDRQSKLVGSQAISRSHYDETRHNLDAARQHIRVVEQEAAQIRAQLTGDPEIAVEKHPRYLAAEAARDKAALDLERTVVRAPFDGIASNTPDPGQQVVGNGAMSSPVMSVIANTGVWVEANFKETELTNVRPGQAATIHVDTYPDREWKGKVKSISQATGAEFSVIPPQNATGNWVKIVQRIPVRIFVQAEGNDPALRAGMSASVEIDTEHQREVPGFAKPLVSLLDDPVPARAAEAQGQQ